MTRGKVWAALAVLGLAILLVATVRHRAGASGEAAEEPKLQPVAVQVATATVGPMETKVLAQGTLTPAQGASARVTSTTSGRLLEVRVVEGQHVRAGQVLAAIDNRPQQYQAQVALQSAQSDREHGVAEAQIALDSARTELRKLQAGARPQEVAQAQQSVIQAQATRDRAVQEKTRIDYLLAHGVASKRQQQDADTALAIANSTLVSAREQLSLVKAGARPEDVQAAKLAVRNAQQALALARETGDAKVRQAEAALAQVEGTGTPGPIAGSSTVLRAPLNGVVTHRYQNPGDMADPASPVVEVANDRELNLVASLPAEEGMKVRAGQRAHFTAEGVAGLGRVLSVGQVDPQTNLLSVRLAVDNTGERLRAGAFARAEIVVSTNPQAVLIPRSAPINREGQTLVLVAGADEKAHVREVTLGGEEGGTVAVVHGVRPGERVIWSGQYALSEGAPITLAKEPARG